MSNPFASSTAKPGHGTIYLALLPPQTSRLRTASYQYPLKLVSPAPTRIETGPNHLVHTVYLLTYGGGLVAGDSIDLGITLERTTRLLLLTQGSTKLFKSPSRDVVSKQRMTVRLGAGSALCCLPDPVQPFAQSCFEQQQIYNIEHRDRTIDENGTLCVLDWVCNGRPANGEDWSFRRYGSKNEIYLSAAEGERKLLLRDNVTLDAHATEGSLTNRMHQLALFGTLILYGPQVQQLGKFFMEEFKILPRIGGRRWDSGSESGDEELDSRTAWRAARQRQETADGLLWSAAHVRGCVIVKFGAREVEIGKRWIMSMLVEEGSIVRVFGERALLCLR